MMPSAVFIFLTVTITYFFVVDGSPISDSCHARNSSFAQCTATVMTDGCKDSTLNLKDTEFTDCGSIQFFWSYPQYNLTISIASSFTEQKTAFAVYLQNKEARTGVNRVFRIRDGQETDVTTSDDILVQHSDENYLCILKFVAPERLQRYGVNIDWEIKKQ